ncbi:MAG: DEAD/DEAH box helicase family protein, partial [Treponema sp.]|nr:DEAD/DEAH box helicase family protein [Treponema sp.]
MEASFDKKLILFNYLLETFGIASISGLGDQFQGENAEETYDGQSGFVQRFLEICPNRRVGRDTVLAYDLNIVKHLAVINRVRQGGEKIKLKYFQYFTLLFIEYYLDCYANDRAKLCAELNRHASRFQYKIKQAGYQIELFQYAEDDLNKIAVWNATGSGKTLLLHINFLQAKHYLNRKNRGTPLLLTPNEGLSEQHLAEFGKAGINAARFDKNGNLFSAQISVIEVTKLAEQNGEETVAAESFGDANILFVDEGHTGASGEKWMDYRRRLCASGFSFEYSATFGQAVAGKNKAAMQTEYAKCIVFDYSYKYFYADGYGKDYNILNLPDAADEKTLYHYLIACLLVFYQQKLLFADLSGQIGFHEFFIENPLLVFVGSTVNAVRTENREKVSDVASVLLFLKRFIENSGDQSVEAIHAVLSGRAGLRHNNTEAFAESFPYLKDIYGFTITQEAAMTIYGDVLKKIFGNALSGSALRVVNLKIEGEIALIPGNSEIPFGLINVGDSRELMNLCARSGIETGENPFADSLFAGLQKRDSSVNILIGSKKFTTGWNCYRVSTMGLMYVGQSEGSDIIQLFGRGVRLWGYKKSLKRSLVMQKDIMGLTPPLYLPYIETLNIFGVKANYMQQFNEFLQNEGLPPTKTVFPPRFIPALKNIQFKNKKLQKLSLPAGASYLKQGGTFVWRETAGSKKTVTLDCYTSLATKKSLASSGKDQPVFEKHKSKALQKCAVFFNYESLFAELVEYKYQREYFNAIVSKDHIKNLLFRADWYELYLPPSLAEPQSFADIKRFREYAVHLLKKEFDKQYAAARNAWEAARLCYVPLDENDPNFVENYEVFLGDRENDKAYTKEFEELLKTLQEAHKNGTFLPLAFSRCGVEIYDMSCGLYRPFLKIAKNMEIVVKPLPLNDSESGFVKKLNEYRVNHPEITSSYEMHLIRNKSRSGIGFFENSGFYPDFILWLIDSAASVQHIVFIEPHGMGHERFR